MGISDQSPTITGATDNTEIGNVTDRLKVDIGGATGLGSISDLVAANKMFSFGVEVNAASAGTNNPLILFRNPSGSGKTIYLHFLSYGTNIGNVNVAGKIFSNPTITTNGTAVTVGSRNIGGGSPAAVALVTTLPTISANGTQLETSVTGQNSNSVLLTTEFSLALAENNSFLFTGNPLSNNRNVVITIVWAET